MEFCSTIWDPHLAKDSDTLEKVQRKAARWARGEYGQCSVTNLLKDLKWAPLADRRRHSRFILFYKILHPSISVNIIPQEVDISRTGRSNPRGNKNPYQLQRPRALGGKSSPLWNSTVYKTLPEWNSLSADIFAYPADTDSVEADPITSFKGRLASASP